MEPAEYACGSELYTWGSAGMGQLGCPSRLVASLPVDSESIPYQCLPTPVKPLSGIHITQVAGGDGHSLAVTSSGKVYAWGASACGQLGLTHIDRMPKDAEGYPFHPEPKVIEGLTMFKIVMVACGDAHSAALTSEGIILTWGGGGCGQLGHNDTELMPKDDDGCPFQPEPRVVDTLNVSVKHISCGKAHTVAITEEGMTYTWGAGACGQLGHADMSSFPIDEDGYPFHPVPKLISSMKKVIMQAAACGDVHTLLLARDGIVYSFGGGSFGQLGLGNVVSLPVDVDDCPYMPIPKPVEVLRRCKVVQVVCGDSHSMALTNTGEVYGWGAAPYGQLGIKHLDSLPKDLDNKPYAPDPIPIVDLKGKHIVALACGEGHTLALARNGLLYSFGANVCGQLGVEAESAQNAPTLVTRLLGKRVSKIACGGVHNIIVTENPSSSLAADLYTCYKRGLYTDVTFKVDSSGRECLVNCHKIVLASKSDYFRKLPKSNEPIAVEFSYEIFLRLLEYLYCDNIEVLLETLRERPSLNQIVELLHLAHTFQLSQLKTACEQHFAQQVTPYLPETFLSTLLSAAKNLVFLADGRAAVVSSQAHARLLEEAIVIDLNAPGSPTGSPPLTASSKDMLRELDRPELSDVTLSVQEREIYAHKVVLAARSEYFSALYSHGFREAKEGVILISDVAYDSMITLLQHMYSDELEVDLDNVMELLALCERFSVSSVKSKCEAALVPSLTVENAAALYKHAKMFNCNKLKDNCLCYINTVYHEVVRTQAFEDLDKNSIIEIMRFNIGS